MEQLMINNRKIMSLENLRQSFDLPQVMAAFLDKRLENWLEQCFYEREAKEVQDLEHVLTPAVERELCKILGVSCPENAELTQEQQEALERKRAAAENGYDDFAEKHNALAVLFHEAMKSREYSRYHLLAVNYGGVAAEFYKNKYEAKSKAHAVINKAYDKANSFFAASGANSIAPAAAERYAERLHGGAARLAKALEPYCKTRRELAEKHAELIKLIGQSEERLRALFTEELADSSDYYTMYERGYFLDRIDIEEHDFNVDVFDSNLLNGLARLIHDESEYTVNGLFETVAELEEDVNRQASTFYSATYHLYQEYCEKIEEIAEEIGENLSGDDMRKLGLASEERSA